MNDEADNRDTDAGIGDVEGRPGIGKANMQINEKKINDVTMGQSIGQIAQHASKE
jgi:hypothetical protein